MVDAAEASVAFEKLLGRAATETEREQLRKIRDALGLRENDALWSVLFALQYYDSLYRQFPKAIATEAAKVLVETRAAAEASVRASIETARADLTRAMAISAQGVAEAVARRRQTQWGLVGILVGAIIFVGGFWVGLSMR